MGLAFGFSAHGLTAAVWNGLFTKRPATKFPPVCRLTLLYDDWDRNPYESPFGLIPHDLAVRLFYLGRSACWHIGPSSLLAHDHIKGGFSPSHSWSLMHLQWAFTTHHSL